MYFNFLGQHLTLMGFNSNFGKNYKMQYLEKPNKFIKKTNLKKPLKKLLNLLQKKIKNNLINKIYKN